MKKIALSFVLVASLCSCGKEKIELIWEQQPSKTEYAIQAVHFLDAKRGYAVGGDSWYYGLSLVTTDGGKTWVADSIANKLLMGLDFNHAGEGVAAGIDGYVFSRREQDPNWSFYRFPVWDFYRGVAHSETATLLVSGAAYQDGKIARLNSSFQLDTVSEFDLELDAVSFVDEQVAIAVGYGLVLRSEDGGRSWQVLPVDGDHFRAVHFPSEKVGYVVGYAGAILKSVDGGKTWEKLRNGGGIWVPNVPFRAVFFVDEETGYLAGEKGIVWKTVNGGADWAVLEGLPEVDYYDLHVIGKEGWLAGEKGTIIHFRE